MPGRRTVIVEDSAQQRFAGDLEETVPENNIIYNWDYRGDIFLPISFIYRRVDLNYLVHRLDGNRLLGGFTCWDKRLMRKYSQMVFKIL